MNHTLRNLCTSTAAALALAVLSPALADPPPAHTVEPSVMANGGGASSAGLYEIEGTIGQIFATTSAVGTPVPYSSGPQVTVVAPGYWSGVDFFCRSDFNGDGSLNPDDLGDYITIYFMGGDSRIDWNGDGQSNPDDIGDFITVYYSDEIC
ncbi:MAG: hypothetical protein ACKVS8_08990 [Phycisphaerales bacterium]